MITQLRLQHFKSWRDTGQMRLAPLTALFGSNSSGKTSLLQWLLLLKQTTESADRSQVLNLGDERSLADLGTFQDLLFKHDTRLPLSWDLEWRLAETLSIEDPFQQGTLLFEGDVLGYSARLDWKKNGKEMGRPLINHIDFRFSGRQFGMRFNKSTRKDYELYSRGFKFIKSQGRKSNLPAPVKCYGFPDQVRASYQNAAFLSDFELAFENLFASLYYLGPLREYPKRQYAWAGSRPGDMGTRGERVVDALLAAREEGGYLQIGKSSARHTLEVRVASWLKELGLVENFEVLPVAKGSKLFQVWVRRTHKSPKVFITDVGFGISQILPVIALCYYVPEGSILILEQPEIHLHPRIQAGLADVFIDAIRTRGIQIILESHSEHLLRRLQRRIAEETFRPDDAALYFCKNESGKSELENLNVDPYGNIENWPADFFGDEFGEIAAMSEAAIRRKRNAAQ